jgi:hypothetical protein
MLLRAAASAASAAQRSMGRPALSRGFWLQRRGFEPTRDVRLSAMYLGHPEVAAMAALLCECAGMRMGPLRARWRAGGAAFAVAPNVTGSSGAVPAFGAESFTVLLRPQVGMQAYVFVARFERGAARRWRRDFAAIPPSSRAVRVFPCWGLVCHLWRRW